MDRQNKHYRQVKLLVQTLHHIAKVQQFALKGGTALNLFIHDLPRLSVDIDLTYIPVNDRQTALREIKDGLARIAGDIEQNIKGAKASHTTEHKVVVRHYGVQIKIELSPVLRGCVHPCRVMEVSDRTEENFGYAEIQLLSFEDLYAGKICAALDRQHPRDLFDIKLLLDKHGITRSLMDTFLVYLIGHNRPISELLAPNIKDIEGQYKAEFVTMCEEDISIEALNKARIDLIHTIQTSLTDKDKTFLILFKSRRPDWSLLNEQQANKLPAVQWKIFNLGKMADDKHQAALNRLKDVLESFK